MAFRPGDVGRLIMAAVILSIVYLSLSSYMRCYFENVRADEWSGGPGRRVKVRYFATQTQRVVFAPALLVESLIAGQRINTELEK